MGRHAAPFMTHPFALTLAPKIFHQFDFQHIISNFFEKNLDNSQIHPKFILSTKLYSHEYLPKIIGYGLGTLAILLLIGVGYIKTQLPNVGPPPELEIAHSDELLARGAYLANHVMVCMDCHSV
jgi:hypothetical protein